MVLIKLGGNMNTNNNNNYNPNINLNNNNNFGNAGNVNNNNAIVKEIPPFEPVFFDNTGKVISKEKHLELLTKRATVGSHKTENSPWSNDEKNNFFNAIKDCKSNSVGKNTKAESLTKEDWENLKVLCKRKDDKVQFVKNGPYRTFLACNKLYQKNVEGGKKKAGESVKLRSNTTTHAPADKAKKAHIQKDEDVDMGDIHKLMTDMTDLSLKNEED